MKKYGDKSNVIGPLLEKYRKDKNLSKEEVSRKLQLHGVYINRVELYRVETSQMIIKDFELIALCEVLDIDYSKLKKMIE